MRSLRWIASATEREQSSIRMRRNASRKDTSAVISPETYFHPAARAEVRLSANPSLSQSLSLKEPTTALSCWIPCGSNVRPDSVLRKLANQAATEPYFNHRSPHRLNVGAIALTKSVY